ncbi:hypothetical protein KS4_33700 [Poriferisphaera corsica]|uniref:Uncharacterized protein n=1 Tax=Poriferisphaera corsica TaxID=2528020 RepID=A0A517YYI7_9BACT|nr:hypothetical protein KS4_33700 [Poriferisphaera corsica]
MRVGKIEFDTERGMSLCLFVLLRSVVLLLTFLLLLMMFGVLGGCVGNVSDKIGTGDKVNIMACTCCKCDPCMCPEKTTKSIAPSTGRVETKVVCPCCTCDVCDCATKS